jgi:hypothetical protein
MALMAPNILLLNTGIAATFQIVCSPVIFKQSSNAVPIEG